jgi:hypothetical protein
MLLQTIALTSSLMIFFGGTIRGTIQELAYVAAAAAAAGGTAWVIIRRRRCSLQQLQIFQNSEEIPKLLFSDKKEIPVIAPN